RQPRPERPRVGGRRRPPRLEPAQPQPDLLLLEVDGADVALLDRADLAAECPRRRQPALDLRPRGRVARDDGAALLEGGDAADERDEGLAAAAEASHQRYRYFRRSRRRTTSAVVLSTKVRQKSRNAARKRTRKSVPPSGASGSSTAMLAERARKPLNMFQSI